MGQRGESPLESGCSVARANALEVGKGLLLGWQLSQGLGQGGGRRQAALVAMVGMGAGDLLCVVLISLICQLIGYLLEAAWLNKLTALISSRAARKHLLCLGSSKLRALNSKSRPWKAKTKTTPKLAENFF